MVEVSKLNGERLVINPDLVRYLEATPDTIITFLDGQKLTVRESVDEVKNRFLNYKKTLFAKEGSAVWI